jgi:hypothetical protein
MSVVHVGMIGRLLLAMSGKSRTAVPFKDNFKKLIHRSLVTKLSPVRKRPEIYLPVTVVAVIRSDDQSGLRHEMSSPKHWERGIECHSKRFFRRITPHNQRTDSIPDELIGLPQLT